jgi:hypothetical protein
MLLDRSQPILAKLIYARTGLSATVRLNLSLLENGSNRRLPLDLDAPAIWPDTAYAWFSVAGVPGGTDAYFDRFDDDDRSIWLDEAQSEHYASWAPHIHSALRIGHSWRFRRSAGQPTVINLAYGVLAAQLAAFCNGFVDSSDSAWDSKLLPAWPSSFLETYFDPGASVSRDFADWARRCLGSLSEELATIARPTSR